MTQGRTPNPPSRPHRIRHSGRKVYATFEARSVAIMAAWAMAASSTVYAQTGSLGDQTRPDEALLAAFVRADTDGNGLLSFKEASAMPSVADNFDKLDLDRDKNLSQDEFLGGLRR